MKRILAILAFAALPSLVFGEMTVQERVQAALAASKAKPAKKTDMPPMIQAGGRTLYLCSDGTCYCPYPDCVCVDGQCVAAGSAKARASCACGAACYCTNGQCMDPNCPTGKITQQRSSYAIPGPGELLLYDLAYNKAVRNNMPLLVWVGETCPSCEAQWTDYIHARLSEFDGTGGSSYTGPGVKVCRPDGLGGMDVVGTLSGIPSKAQVDASVKPVQAQQQVPQQIFRPMPMMMPMMGGCGFGGGCMGGFCGGGGCGGGG